MTLPLLSSSSQNPVEELLFPPGFPCTVSGTQETREKSTVIILHNKQQSQVYCEARNIGKMALYEITIRPPHYHCRRGCFDSGRCIFGGQVGHGAEAQHQPRRLVYR